MFRKKSITGGVATLIIAIALTVLPTTLGEGVTITILHTNDVHSRFAQTNKRGGFCSVEEERDSKCYGGFARLHYKVNEIRSTHKNVLYLSGGDYYQGTVWYTIHKWRIVSELVNTLNHTALALGNHEFDDGISGLTPFVDAATFPIVDCNIDAAEEPDFQARQITKKITKSVVVTAENGAKIGIIGFTTQDTSSISHPEKLKFLDVVESVNKEAERLSSEEGVKILIALGHGGFDVEQQIASRVPLIDAVVGGHTNTFLYTGQPPDLEKPVGPYPFMVTQEGSSRQVPVVQAYAFGKYLGYLNLTFNDDGELTNAQGNPILLDATVPQDEAMLSRVNEWGRNVSELTKMEVGKTRVFLNGKSEDCRLRECNLGNFIADAMVFVNLRPTDNHWSDVTMALINSGGIRGSLDERRRAGSINYQDVLQVLPFQNTVDLIEIKGSDLLEALEHSISGYNPKAHRLNGKFLQVSGMKVVYDISQPDGSRVKTVQVLCKHCREPSYVPLNGTQIYKVAVPTYIATGGDGFAVLKNKAVAHYLSGILDADMLIEYLKYKSPVIQPIEGRIDFVKDTGCQSPTPKNDNRRASPSSLLELLFNIGSNIA